MPSGSRPIFSLTPKAAPKTARHKALLLAAGIGLACLQLASPAQGNQPSSQEGRSGESLWSYIQRLVGKADTPSTPTIGGPVRMVRAIDGDTIAIGDRRIRMHGIDAPERQQACIASTGASLPCGELSRSHLELLIRGTTAISCTIHGQDRYERSIGTCRTSENVDLNRAMVRQGWALAYMEYGGEAYAEDERRAREDGLGMHTTRFETPSEHRRRQRQSRH